MCSTNPLNVFKGSDALAQFFDPDQNPPLPLVELPDALNPLRQDGVRIFAKMLTQLPAQNVKSLPALRMLRHESGASSKRIVEASSGSTVLSLGMVARALWNHEDVHAYVTNKKHPDSLKLLRFFGLNVNLYGGLAQQEPYDPKGIMARLRKLATNDKNICYPGQYHNDHNWKSHEQWTGAQIWKQLPETRVFCSTVGTGGCAVGTGTYLKTQNPSIKVLGVCNVFGDPTPGPRHFPNFESSPFPWQEAIDNFEDVSSADSYRASMKLSRHGIIAGPSSGEALHGLLAFLQRMKLEDKLQNLADPATGEIPCVFICADLPYQYMDMYYKKLGEEEFPNINNENLLHCDQDPYDERWFLTPVEAMRLLLESRPVESVVCSAPSAYSNDQYGSRPELIVLDLRPLDDYTASHVTGSRNNPLRNAREDFFSDADAVEERWHEMRHALESEEWSWRNGKTVLVLCSDGDSGRMATAILRAKGCDAFCVEGGYPALTDNLGDGGTKVTGCAKFSA
ncbi:cysteine synthase B [Amniculicola lignicola CBS 123094]|uniref:Cysteine synthase B n=1 Tax=Amniculicola lignicola CBS 123094 TaxID=1392246 RepID=A0A6A5WTJ7_9PLEO|nr:cysteine synthase B [Amniculicola lignicola CBS 123094]